MVFSAYKYAMKKNFWSEKRNIYFIGIGGISMSGLAQYLHFLGFRVSGSDLCRSAITSKLESFGIKIYYKHDGANLLGADAVICGSAISESNPEVCAARGRGIPIVSRAELLHLVSQDFENVIGVAGCHGKTTATAMAAHILKSCSENVTAHIGGEDYEFGNFYIGGKKYFVTEACEYKGNFLSLKPDVAVVLNTDADHLDCYADEAALEDAYVQYITSASASIVWKDDKIVPRVAPTLTFGSMENCDICAKNIRGYRGKYSFQLQIFGQIFDRIKLNVYGKHNIYNALAAASVAVYYGYPSYFIAEGLKNFQGIRRRFELLGRAKGAEWIADYAHHPKEIAAVLQAVSEFCDGRLFVVFQPHTYSRTKIFLKEFVKALGQLENLVIYKTYPAREYFDAEGSALTLSEHLPQSLYVESVRELEIYLKCSVQAGDVILFLGAGDIYYVAKQVLLQIN